MMELKSMERHFYNVFGMSNFFHQVPKKNIQKKYICRVLKKNEKKQNKNTSHAHTRNTHTNTHTHTHTHIRTYCT